MNLISRRKFINNTSAAASGTFLVSMSSLFSDNHNNIWAPYAKEYNIHMIGHVTLENATVTIPYDEEKDIMFLTAEGKNYRIAAPGKFFLFFPQDAHRPTVKSDENIPVRKIVVKVRIN